MGRYDRFFQVVDSNDPSFGNRRTFSFSEGYVEGVIFDPEEVEECKWIVELSREKCLDIDTWFRV